MTTDERQAMREAIAEHAHEKVQRVVWTNGVSTVETIEGAQAQELLRGRVSSKEEDQLALVRDAVDCLCAIGNMEPSTHLTAISTLVLRAMTPLRNLEAKLVRKVEENAVSEHVKTATPTPGMAIR